MSTAREPSAVDADADADADVLAPAADDSGFDAFYAQNYAPLLRVMVGFTRRRAVAEELAQEALLAAYRRWDHVHSLDRPDLWLRRVAVNRAISLHRRLISEVAALGRLRAERPTPEPPAADEAIWAAVRRLPRTQAAAIALWAVSGYTLAEVGEVLGCSEETARTHLRRARQKLATTLGVGE